MHLDTDIPTIDESQSKDKGLRDLWSSPVVKKLRRFIGAILYHTNKLLGDVVAVILALAIMGAWFLANVLDQQSTDLTVLRPNIKLWFAEAFNGHDADFGRLELTWLPADDHIVVTIENAEVRGEAGEVLERFELIRSTLSHDGQSTQLPHLINAEINGGVLSYVQDESGQITAGLGLPEALGRIGPVYRNNKTSNVTYDFKNTLKELEFIQINDVEIYFKNAMSGVDLKSDLSSLRAAFSDAGNLTIDANGTVDQPSNDMSFSVTSVLDQDLNDIKIRMKVTDARPNEIGPTQGRFWDLRGLSAPVDLTAQVDFSRQDGLRSASIDLDACRACSIGTR